MAADHNGNNLTYLIISGISEGKKRNNACPSSYEFFTDIINIFCP